MFEIILAYGLLRIIDVSEFRRKMIDHIPDIASLTRRNVLSLQ